jgi:carboxymethylenebutenolidase
VKRCAIFLLAAACLVLPRSAFAAGKGAIPVSSSKDTARVHLGPADGGTDAFVAFPPGTNPGPAVIVIHEWWGLNGQIRGVARELALQGYIAIVPDLYHGKVADDPDYAHILMRGLDEEAAMVDIDAAVAWLRAQPRTAKTKIGIVGFCMGGGVSQMFALHSTAVSAAIMFYGSPELNPEKLATLRAPLQGHFGALDQGIEVDRVEKFKAALAVAGKTNEIYVYAGAGHAFMNQTRPSYSPDAARLAWARTLAFFQKYLKG